MHAERLENSAEHSWSLAIMAIVFREAADMPVDLGRVLELVAAHDLVEIDAGDTFCYDVAGNVDKPAREAAAADRLFGLLPESTSAVFRDRWDEFERRQTPESKFANALDRLLPLIQHREHGGAVWKANHVTREQVLARIAPVALASKALHDYALSIIDEAVAAGWIE